MPPANRALVIAALLLDKCGVISGLAIRRLFLSALLALFLISSAEAGPFADLFKALRRSFGPPPPRHSHHTSSHKTQNADGTGKSQQKVDGPPNDSNTRAARLANSSGGKKSDMQYGTPVPGKPGFVTSPFAPDGGYIDVRGFEPGTQVKDPYTGKMFLTP